MRVLWVEDESDIIKGGVNTHFRHFFTNRQLKKLNFLNGFDREDYLKKINIPIYIVSNFYDALKTVYATPPFDRILLDVDLPFYTVNDKPSTEEEAKFVEDKKNELQKRFKINKSSDFDNLWTKKYVGIILAHFITHHYHHVLDIPYKEQSNFIGFYSAKQIDVNEFLERCDSSFVSDGLESIKDNFWEKGINDDCLKGWILDIQPLFSFFRKHLPVKLAQYDQICNNKNKQSEYGNNIKLCRDIWFYLEKCYFKKESCEAQKANINIFEIIFPPQDSRHRTLDFYVARLFYNASSSGVHYSAVLMKELNDIVFASLNHTLLILEKEIERRHAEQLRKLADKASEDASADEQQRV